MRDGVLPKTRRPRAARLNGLPLSSWVRESLLTLTDARVGDPEGDVGGRSRSGVEGPKYLTMDV